jgi:hypothetical protein
LTCCQRAEDREEVDNSLLNFAPNHTDIMMNCFIATLPPSFKVVDLKEKDTNDDKNKDKKGTKKRKNDEKKEKHKKMMADSIVANKHQCLDFKL